MNVLATSTGGGGSSSSSSSSGSWNRRLLAVAAAKATALVLIGLWRYCWYKNHKEEKNEKEYHQLCARIPPRSIAEFEQAALPKLSPLARVYFQYFSDPGVTDQACRTFYRSLRLLPTILTGDVRNIDTTLTLFGKTLELPVLVAPSAFHVLACPEGEIATARGTGAGGAGYCYNWMLSSKLYKDVLPEPGVKWLHLYMFEERDLVEASIKTAMATGAFSAILLTCDHPHQRVQSRMMPFFTTSGFPYSNLDDSFFPNQGAMGFHDVTLKELLDPNSSKMKERANPGGTNSAQLSWDDVKWIQSMVPPGTPIVAKGILSAADAKQAVQVGVDAIVVSNHGGRQCDLAVPAIEALPVVVDAVQGKIPVFVDSGVRSSSDIIKALCLGATGVMLGRPALWALACGGSDALERMFSVLKADLQDDLRSLGVLSIRDLGRQHLWPPDRERIESIVASCK